MGLTQENWRCLNEKGLKHGYLLSLLFSCSLIPALLRYFDALVLSELKNWKTCSERSYASAKNRINYS